MKACCLNCANASWAYRWEHDLQADLPEDVEIRSEACTPLHICLSGGEQEYWSGRERSHPYWRGKEPWTFPPPIDSQYCLSAVGTCRMRGTKLFWPFLFTSDSGAPPVEQEFPPCEDWALQREALTLEEE